MKFAAAIVLAAAAGASAYGGNVTVTTEIVDVYTTYCPFATQITHGSMTYTVTEATTLTITNCPCTITRPVYTSSAVACSTCSSAAVSTETSSMAISSAVSSSIPVYTNATTPVVSATNPPPAGTSSVASPTGSGVPPSVPTGGAGKAAVLSGAGLAGIVGLAAFIL